MKHLNYTCASSTHTAPTFWSKFTRLYLIIGRPTNTAHISSTGTTHNEQTFAAACADSRGHTIKGRQFGRLWRSVNSHQGRRRERGVDLLRHIAIGQNHELGDCVMNLRFFFSSHRQRCSWGDRCGRVQDVRKYQHTINVVVVEKWIMPVQSAVCHRPRDTHGSLRYQVRDLVFVEILCLELTRVQPWRKNTKSRTRRSR